MKINFTISLFCLLLIFAARISAQQPENGFELYAKGEYQKAIEVFQKAVADNDGDKKSWMHLGMSYARSNDDERAVKAFEKAAAIAPKEPGDGESPPQYLFNPPARYTDAARRKGVNGKVKLAVEFGADGEIKYVFPFKKLSGGLTENAVASARSIEFEPATKNGKPVSFIAIVIYGFEIR